jgi:Icc-related predicted phosphoesterase
MATIILGITDTHWTEKRPRSRTDPNFKNTQARKIKDLFRLAKQIKMPGQSQSGATAIVHSGDLFHQPYGKLISRRLDTWIIPLLRESPVPLYAIPGNHDMKAHRQESLEDHPYGVLLADDIIKQATWPTYYVVGDNPPVIITGREFTPQGPKPWLDNLRVNSDLINLKKSLSESTGKKVQTLALTHCWWGPVDGVNRGEPLVGYNSVADTGIDIMMYGHPHTMDGINKIQDSFGQSLIIGPGAFIRGTLAEHDVNRQPMINVMFFYEDGTHSALLVAVPHDPPAKVFDLAKHQKVKKEAEVETQFIQELSKIDTKDQTLEQLLEKAGQGTPPQVLSLAKQYITLAEELRQ